MNARRKGVVEGTLVGKKDEIIAIMAAYLPNFEHIETGKGLDSKM